MMLAFNGISGDYLEFGSHGGSTFVQSFQESRGIGHRPHLLAFDDYYCYSPQMVSGEKLAFDQFRGDNFGWEFVPYSRIGWHGMSFIAETRNRNPAAKH